MPYIIKEFKKGFKVCKKDDPSKCFSKKPIPKINAEKQLKAIGMSEGGAKQPSIKEGKKNLLEMFKGTGSVGKVAVKFNYDVVSIDLDPIFTPIIETDILDWDYKKFQKENNYKPDFIWASPPCNTFSPLAYPLKERNIENAKPKSKRAKIGTKILYRTLDIINFFKKINPDLKYVIENPRGMMRKDILMKKLHRETTLYCLYGDFKRKATDFFSNFDMELLKPEDNKCDNKNLVPVVNLPLEKRYSIPSKLIKHIFKMANKNDILPPHKMGSSKPSDEKLYNEIKEKVYAKNPKHSLFRSGQVVKEYKKAGGEYDDVEDADMNIKKWFKQKWISLNDYYHNGDIVPCGSSNTEDKFSEYPLCRPLKIAKALKPKEMKKMIDKKNELEEKPLITKKLLKTDKYNIKATNTGMGMDKFIKQLHSIDFPPESYLQVAQKVAKREGYDPKKLSFANNNDNKLVYDSPEGKKYFGKAGYGDYIIWLFKERNDEVKKGYADVKRNVFRKSHNKISELYNLGKYSPNELALKILW
jgi:hypothetical protein